MYPVSCETLEECTVCFIPKQDFINTLHETPFFYKKLIKAVCREVDAMAESFTQLAQKTVRERLAITLLMLKDTYGLDGMENGPVEINLKREDLANIVGTATETLIRLLHDFKEEKLISVKGRKIKVENLKGLMRVGNLY
jgi:CRP/FNR family transcriptional regulator